MPAHAKTVDCKLLFDPTYPTDIGDDGHRVRLRNLRDFLASSDGSFQAMTYKRQHRDNLTILGTWWMAESLQKRGSDYEETMFTWHAATVRRFASEFDEEFETACRQRGVNSAETLTFAVDEINRALA
jgi:hypothetical protein